MTEQTDRRPAIRPDAQELWVQRLIDGSYLQMTGELVEGWVGNPPEAKDAAGHSARACCLGVLTGCAIEKGVEDVRWWRDPVSSKTYVQVWDEEQAGMFPDNDEAGWVDYTDEDLPYPVARWAFGEEYAGKFDASNPVLTPDGYKAIDLNDQEGKTFEEIAEFVRALPTREVD